MANPVLEPIASLYLDRALMWIEFDTDIFGSRPIVQIPHQKHFGVDDPTDISVGEIRKILSEFCDIYFEHHHKPCRRVHIEESVEIFQERAYFSVYKAFSY